MGTQTLCVTSLKDINNLLHTRKNKKVIQFMHFITLDLYEWHEDLSGINDLSMGHASKQLLVVNTPEKGKVLLSL